jgi:hypothetical protein
MRGLTTFTNAGVLARAQADNNLLAGVGFVSLNNVTIQSDLGASGAACNLP